MIHILRDNSRGTNGIVEIRSPVVSVLYTWRACQKERRDDLYGWCLTGIYPY
jgi:hypothetical protein